MITASHNAGEYLEATRDFFEQREVVHNLPYGLTLGLNANDALPAGSHLLHCEREGRVVATLVKTYKKVILGVGEYNTADIDELAAYCRANGIEAEGVHGEYAPAMHFAEQFHGGRYAERAMLAYELTEVRPPCESRGSMRAATDADLPMLTNWIMEFHKDVHESPITPRDEVMQRAATRIASGSIFLWIVEDEPVSMAGVVRRTPHVATIGLVYTPPELRGSGYASNCVWTLSRDLLAQGYQKCCLFTETLNPTSNKIYQDIGYVPIAEFTDIVFV